MELLLRVDPDSGVPRHRQVYEALRSAILTGRLRPGDRLPATRVLAAQLQVSRTTVTEAYDQLQAEGYLLGRQGSGTYVAPSLPAALPPQQRPVRPSPIPLSPWGRALAEPGYAAALRRPAGREYHLDFRPHQVAPDSFPWDEWRSAVDRALAANRQRLRYYPPAAGAPELREAIAAHVARYRAVICSPEQVIIVGGSQQGLNLLSLLLLQPGDRVAVEDPGYPAARLALGALGMRIEPVPVDGEGMMIEALAERAQVQLVHVTPSHQDPTGVTLSLSRRLALLEVAERSGAVILEDDYDSEFRYEGRPVESLQGLDERGSVVYAGTFSKSVLPGLRAGFLIVPSGLAALVARARSLWDGGAPLLEQIALAEFMRSGAYERHIRRTRRLYHGRRDAMIAALDAAFGPAARFEEPHGGLKVLVSLCVPVSESKLIQAAAERGIGLRGASSYFAAPPEHPTLLLAFASLDEEQIRQGITALAAVVTELCEKTTIASPAGRHPSRPAVGGTAAR